MGLTRRHHYTEQAATASCHRCGTVLEDPEPEIADMFPVRVAQAEKVKKFIEAHADCREEGDIGIVMGCAALHLRSGLFPWDMAKTRYASCHYRFGWIGPRPSVEDLRVRFLYPHWAAGCVRLEMSNRAAMDYPYNHHDRPTLGDAAVACDVDGCDWDAPGGFHPEAGIVVAWHHAVHEHTAEAGVTVHACTACHACTIRIVSAGALADAYHEPGDATLREVCSCGPEIAPWFNVVLP